MFKLHTFFMVFLSDRDKKKINKLVSVDISENIQFLCCCQSSGHLEISDYAAN